MHDALAAQACVLASTSGTPKVVLIIHISRAQPPRFFEPAQTFGLNVWYGMTIDNPQWHLLRHLEHQCLIQTISEVESRLLPTAVCLRLSAGLPISSHRLQSDSDSSVNIHRIIAQSV